MARLVLVVLAMLFASAALASETRMGVLASPTGLQDESNVFEYPATVVKHDVALVELGTAADTNVYGGVLKKLKGSSVGLVVSRDESLMTSTWIGTPSLADAYLSDMCSNTAGKLPAPERPIDILYGMPLGGKKALGLGATIASYKSNEETGTGTTNKTTKEADQIDFHIGYSSFGGARYDIGVDLGLMGNLTSSTDNGTTKTEYSYKRGTHIQINGRYFMKPKGPSNFIAGNLGLRSATAKADNGTTSEEGKFDETFLLIEGGTVMKPAKTTLVTGSVGLLYGTSKGPTVTGTGAAAVPSLIASDEQAERKTQWVFSKLGIETKVSESFGALGGLRYMLLGSTTTTDKTAAGEPKTEESVSETSDANLWSLGMYYVEKKLRIDVLGTKAFLHNGPFFISGGNTGAMFGMISMTYQL